MTQSATNTLVVLLIVALLIYAAKRLHHSALMDQKREDIAQLDDMIKFRHDQAEKMTDPVEREQAWTSILDMQFERNRLYEQFLMDK